MRSSRIERLADSLTQIDAGSIRACATSLLGRVIDLLNSFIGEDLTAQLVHRVYAQVPPHASHGPEGDET